MFGTAIWNGVATAGGLACFALWRTRRSRATAVCLVALLAAHALHRDLVVDDSFITLRYARSLALGQGLVFNPGERVEGFTSPLWVLWLALAHLLRLDALLVARLTGFACAAATVLLLWRCSLRARPATLAVAAPLLLVLDPSFATWAAAGLETPLFALLVLAAVHASMRGRHAPAAACAAIAVVVRPEAMALPPLLLAGNVLAGRRPGARQAALLLLPAAGVALALALARHAYYGSWMPNTYHAKVDLDLAAAARGGEYVLRFIVLHGGLAVWILPLLAPVLRRDGFEIAGATFLGYVAVIVLLGGDGLPAFRFLVPLLPLAYLMMQESAALLVARGRGLAVPAAIGLAALAAQTANAYPAWEHDRRVMRDFVALGRSIGPCFEPEDRIAVSAAGAIGYYTRAQIVDRLGLTDASLARSRFHAGASPGHAKYDARAVLQRRPTLLTVDWNGLYPEPPPALDHATLARYLELRFDGPDLFASSALQSDYEPLCLRVRESGWCVLFVRRDRAPALALMRAGRLASATNAALRPAGEGL